MSKMPTEIDPTTERIAKKAARPLFSFTFPEDDIVNNQGLNSLFCDYKDARKAFAKALKDLNTSMDALRKSLDKPIRNAGFLSDQETGKVGKHWKLKEDTENDTLIIEVYAEEPTKGKGAAKPAIKERRLPSMPVPVPTKAAQK